MRSIKKRKETTAMARHIRHISVEGSIASGKSTLLAAVSERLQGLNVSVFQEPVTDPTWKQLMQNFYKDPERWAFHFQLHVLLTHLPSLQKKQDDEFVVSERSTTTARNVFGLLAHQAGSMTGPQWETYCQIDQHLGSPPDFFIFVETPAAVCLERIEKRSREGEASIELSYLRQIEFRHQKMRETMTKDAYCIVDGQQSEEDLADHVTAIILEKFVG